MNLWQRFKQWIFNTNSTRIPINTNSTRIPIDITAHNPLKKQLHKIKILWDSRIGTYRRMERKLQRNDPCPCGSMRTAPKDITKRNKIKWCDCSQKGKQQ